MQRQSVLARPCRICASVGAGFLSSSGFCQNGQIMTAKAMLDKNPTPTDAQIRQGMASTLCRCMTYYRIQAAIKRASKTIATASNEPASEVIA